MQVFSLIYDLLSELIEDAPQLYLDKWNAITDVDTNEIIAWDEAAELLADLLDHHRNNFSFDERRKHE